MAEQLKNMYFTKSSLNGMADTMQRFYPAFDKKRFLELIFDGLENMELKEKMRHTTLCLRKTLPDSLAEALTILEQAAPFVKGFEAMSLPDYAELYGTDKENWDMAFKAMGVFTQYSSSEFAVRPFLDSDPEKALAYMKKWAADKNPKLRRLASEGCRPRLPWAMALPKFKKDPAPILPILEKLKDDPSEDVRRSVANNINDISKDNPEVALELCEKWTGHSQETDGVIKHACRTMLKAGNKRAMVLFGYSDPAGIKVENLTLDKDKIQLGEALNFF
ncbi:MAG: DNA alkylation repair protein, partial [bacterium]|nr:DNA alkylation repair protein [bacterium]